MRTNNLNEKELESIKRIMSLIDTECNGRAQTFADKVGIAKASVSHYKHMIHAPSQDHAYLIGRAFNVNPLWVMGFDVPKDNKPDLSEKSAHLVKKRIEDPRLTEALEKYFDLPPEKKMEVIDFIDYVYYSYAKSMKEL